MQGGYWINTCFFIFTDPGVGKVILSGAHSKLEEHYFFKI